MNKDERELKALAEKWHPGAVGVDTGLLLAVLSRVAAAEAEVARLTAALNDAKAIAIIDRRSKRFRRTGE